MNSTDLTNIEKLYNSLQKDGFTNLGTINEFREKLKNTDKQKALYTSLKKNGYTNLGTFDEFTEKIFEKPEPDITLPVDTPTQPKQIKAPPAN